MSKIRSIFSACVAVLALSVAAVPAANAAPWVFTTTGTIFSGFDTTGVFGTAGTNLKDMSFIQTFTLDPTAYSVQSTGTYFNDSFGQLGGGIATDTVTVNGVTRIFTWDLSQLSSGRSLLQNYVTHGSGDGSDVALQEMSGFTADGRQLVASGALESITNPFNLALNFDQTWSRVAQAGDLGNSSFSISGLLGDTYFDAQTATISISTPVAAVPEPESYAMLLAGLGLMGFIARRRKNLAA